MQFMTPHITNNRHQESNLPVTHTEVDTALSEENGEDTHVNGTPKESVPLESTTPSESPTVVQQASSSQSNRDDYNISIVCLANDVG
jgi:hypothetical protein